MPLIHLNINYPVPQGVIGASLLFYFIIANQPSIFTLILMTFEDKTLLAHYFDPDKASSLMQRDLNILSI